MSDSSSLVPWLTALLGLAASYALAKFAPRELSVLGVTLAGAKAFALGIVSFFVGSLLHGICIESLHRCATHGDGNITYAMGGVMAFPLYWIVIAFFGRVNEVRPIRSIATECQSACSVALLEHLEGRPDTTRCPACQQVISTSRHKSQSSDAYVATRCACGKCDKSLQVRHSEA
jgi:hypothetical protein